MKTNDDLMQMILISLLKLTIEHNNKGLTAECEYNGIRYKLVFAPADDFRMVSKEGESDDI